MHVSIELNRGSSGGGNIGLTNDTAAPTVRMTDDEALQRFPTPYKELVGCCRKRYADFRQNRKFHDLMKEVNEESACTYVRLLDPVTKTAPKKRFYNLEAVFSRLDDHYSLVTS